MYYQQAVYCKPERVETAKALLREHFRRVQEETGCAFGEVEFDPLRHFGPGMKVLSASAEISKPFDRPSSSCSEIELALMESLWSTLH